MLYLYGMANELVARRGERAMMILTRPGRAAPSQIDAMARMEDLGLTLSFSVRVDPGGSARVTHLSIDPVGLASGAITSTALHAIRLGELAREAVRQVEQDADMIEDETGTSGAFRLPGAAAGEAWVSPVPGRRRTPKERAAEAARIYNAALTKGSDAPTVAVASEMRVSRSQASRYVRAARDGGLIQGTAPTDPRGTEPLRVDPVANPLVKPEPGLSIFRDPNGPWPGQQEGGEGAEHQDR